MREHQIVITLKPEQFLQVQKLARSAGAKSMGMFVRQQLLAALGIEGSIQGKVDADVDLEPIKTELKRLHAELREFVSESLSTYSTEFDLSNESTAISVELQSGLSFFVESPDAEPGSDYDYQTDEMERTAEKTFAISPRLGAFESAEVLPIAKKDMEEGEADPVRELEPGRDPEQTRRDPEQTRRDPEQTRRDPEQTRRDPEQTRRDPEQTRRDPEQTGRDPEQRQEPKPGADPLENNTFDWSRRSISEKPFEQKAAFMAKPDSKDADASESPAPVSKTPWVFSGPEQIAAAKDLERDPLSELLGANEMAQQAAPDSSSSNIDDDDSYDVPLSILTRRRQLAQMRGLEQPNEEKEKEAALNKPVSSVPPAKPDKPGLSDRERSPDKPAQKTEETPKTQDAQKSSGSYAVYNPLENPDDDSPFSGGPPPKKRQ